jgi:glyoxylate reductase
MSRVLVTQAIDPAGLAILEEAGVQVDLREGAAPIERAELLARLAACRGLMTMPTDRVDDEVLAAGPLAIVANHAVGHDNVDLEAARRRGVVITNTPDVLTEATAELTLALMLAVARHLVAADRFLRQGRFVGWRPTLFVGAELRGATLGIVGLGRIGRAVARRAEAFGMRVVHHGRCGGISLDELLAAADVVSLHCPLTPATRHLLGEAELRRMKPSALLINTARGPVVDEAALGRALTEGWIAGAGLDVYEREPEVHPSLLPLHNVVLLPHLGSASASARRAMAVLAAKNLVAVLGGDPPLNPV